MPREQVNQLQNLGIPFRGMSSSQPVVGLSPEYAVVLNNMQFKNGVLQEREGIRRTFIQGYDNSGTDVFVYSIGAITRGLTDTISAYSTNDTATITNQFRVLRLSPSAQTTQTFTDGAVPADRYITICEFAQRVFAFRMAGTPGVDTGSAFSTVGFTGPTLADCIGAASYNSRMYVIAGTSLWYSPTAGAIAGAFTELPLANLIPTFDTITNAFPFAVSGSINAEQLLGVVTESGQCLIFRGDDPGASNWELAGTFFIGAPVGIQTWTKVNGDVMMMLESGILSMRGLVQAGGENLSQSMLTSEIADFWKILIKGVKNGNNASIYTNKGNAVNATFDGTNNRLIIAAPVFVTRSDGSSFGWEANTRVNSMLVYDFSIGAWSLTTLGELVDLINPNLGISGLYFDQRTSAVYAGVYGPIGLNVGSSDPYIANLNSGIYSDNWINGGDEYKPTVNITLGSLYTSRQQGVSGVGILHSGTEEQKSSTIARLAGNLSGVLRRTSMPLGGGASFDVYNVGEASRFIEVSITSGRSFTMSADTTPYQIGNISILNQSGGIL